RSFPSSLRRVPPTQFRKREALLVRSRRGTASFEFFNGIDQGERRKPHWSGRPFCRSARARSYDRANSLSLARSSASQPVKQTTSPTWSLPGICLVVHSIVCALSIDFAFEPCFISDPIGTRRFGHELAPFPLAQDPTCILACDSRHRGKVTLIDHAGNQ